MSRDEQEAIFLRWVGEHESLLWKVARAFSIAGREDEMYQDLLIAVWKSVPSYRGDAKVSTFLYRVVHNRAIAVASRRRRQTFAPFPPDIAEGPADPLLEELYAAIRRLREGERSLALLYLDGLSYSEMAEVLGITETNVGVRISRLKKRLSEIVHGS